MQYQVIEVMKTYRLKNNGEKSKSTMIIPIKLQDIFVTSKILCSIETHQLGLIVGIKLIEILTGSQKSSNRPHLLYNFSGSIEYGCQIMHPVNLNWHFNVSYNSI